MESILTQEEELRVKSSLNTKNRIDILKEFTSTDINNANTLYNDIHSIGDAVILRTPTISLYTLINSTIDLYIIDIFLIK